MRYVLAGKEVDESMTELDTGPLHQDGPLHDRVVPGPSWYSGSMDRGVSTTLVTHNGIRGNAVVIRPEFNVPN